MSQGYSLKELTSWKVGGEAASLIVPHTASEALDFLKICREMGRKFYILGGGTNILVSDEFIDASVLYTVHINKMYAEDCGDKVELHVDCGCTTKQLISYALENNLGGVAFLAGIPGSIGGALYGNAAGRADQGFRQIVKEITVIGSSCEVKHYKKNQLNWQYRSCPVTADDLMITSCLLELPKVEKQEIVADIRRFSALKKGQPMGKFTAGCVFKNPEGLSAGKLIDEAGCCGMRVGGAVVSASHANFIENENNATAKDIYKLSQICRQKVLEKYGVELEYEIHFFGNFNKD